MPTTTPASGEPIPEGNWTETFDMHDGTSCVSALESALDGLPEAARTLLGAEGNRLAEQGEGYDLTQHIHSTMTTLEEQANAADLDDERTTGLEELIEALDRAEQEVSTHGSCMCSYDEWQGNLRDIFDSAIADALNEFPSWALFAWDDKPQGSGEAAPTGTDIWRILNARDGWDSLTLTWDAATRRLDFRFGSQPSMWFGHLVALTAAQEQVADKLEAVVNDYLFAGMAGLSARHLALGDPFILDLVISLWGDANDDDQLYDLAHAYDEDIEEVIRVLTAQTADLSAAAREAVTHLAKSWKGTVEALISTAATVAADTLDTIAA